MRASSTLDDGLPPRRTAAAEPPLVVDMDGTLLRTDSLVESLFVLAKKRPLALLSLPWALRRGRAGFKRFVAERAQPEIDTLPFNEPLLDHLRAEKRRGRRLVLATAADQLLAHRVAEHLGLFDEVLASDGRRNLAGPVKCERLVAAFGVRGFDYAGDSRRDLPIWRAARRAIPVGDAVHRLESVHAVAPVERCFIDESAEPRARARAWLQELRWHHWLKSALVLLPLVLAHRVADPAALARAVTAAIAFGLAASSVYVLNDLFDLPQDRRHPRKRLRPIAGGRLPLSQAIAAVPLLWSTAAWATRGLPAGAGGILAAYVAGMIAYSLRLKDWRYVDALVLGGGYTLRLVLGAVVLGQGFDPWLAAWSLPTFFGLAMLKRRAELACAVAAAAPGTEAHVRSYHGRDAHLLEIAGLAASWLGVAVLGLMPLVHADDTPFAIGRWTICALLAAWTHRLWRLAAGGRIDDDPVLFTLRDRTTWAFAAAAAAVFAGTS